MLTYVTRRVLYSIPVVLVASFLLFAFVRAPFDPTAHIRSSETRAVVHRARDASVLVRPAAHPVPGRRPEERVESPGTRVLFDRPAQGWRLRHQPRLRAPPRPAGDDAHRADRRRLGAIPARRDAG